MLSTHEFYFGRLLTESKRNVGTYRRGQEACENGVLPSLHANLTQRRHQAPAPRAGGISLERCAAPCGDAVCDVRRRSHLARFRTDVRTSCCTHKNWKLAVPNLQCLRWLASVRSPLTRRGRAPLALCLCKSAAVAACHSLRRPLFHRNRCATVKRLYTGTKK